MADRRMFSKRVVDSDAFMDMPHSAQLLYFHLGMCADDDGFINGAKGVVRTVSCCDTDLQTLVHKGFIITFESGVVVIAHWRVNNYIQKDRYQETLCQDEKRALVIEDGKVYSLKKESVSKMDTGLDTGLDTQLGKLGKISIGEDSIGETADAIASPPAPYSEIVDLFNSTCTRFPKVKNLSDERKKAIRARLRQYSVDDFKSLFEIAEKSKFLQGENDRNWTATFDWLIKGSNMAKVLDGNYSNQGGNKHARIGFSNDSTKEPLGIVL